MEEKKNELMKEDANQTTNHVPNTGPLYSNKDTDLAPDFFPEADLPPVDNYFADEYETEAAAEFAAPIDYDVRSSRNYEHSNEEDDDIGAGRVFGYIALALAILSLFTAPLLFGIGAIVLGFIARGRGARGSASWAIGIGVLSVIISLFLAPFF